MAESSARILRDTSRRTLTGDPVIEEARRRWDRCSEWEANARKRFISDIEFRNGDSDNGYQWPAATRTSRDVDGKPCLTMNIVRQHNLQISNQAKKNKQAIKILAMGKGATQESANVYKDIIRHIEYKSSAQDCYSLARDFQIDGGIGYIRLATDYEDADSFDQEIFIRPIIDPQMVYLDPDIQRKDGLDAKFGFIFDDLPRDDFEELYPEYAKTMLEGLTPLGVGAVDDDWSGHEKVRICEYFRIVEEPEDLLSFVHLGERKTVRKSKLHPKIIKKITDDPLTKVRSVMDRKVEWKLIVGEEVVDETEWPGKYIPILRCIGEETTIGGSLDRKGHTRAMKDAQRMYNYNASAQVEFAALQGKTPWIVAAKAIEELEPMWNTANTANHSVLIYNHMDPEGASAEPIPPPHRQDPPNAAPAYQAGMDTAFNQMMMTSGQFENQMGMQGNERTGEAIGRRQEQSETAVYHFEDNYESMLIALGKQLIDLIPKVYDTRRIKSIVAEDGTDYELEIDPAAKQAYQQHLGHNNEVIKRIFNPQIGRFDVAASVGPAMGTKRRDTVDALTLIVTQAPSLTNIVGDILLGNMDFEGAQEAAQRLKRMVPPMALGQGPTQTEQQLTQQLQAIQSALKKSLETQAKHQLKLTGKEEMRDIEVYEAETKRMGVFKDALPMDQQGLQQLIDQLVGDALQNHLNAVGAANSEAVPNEEGPSQPEGGQEVSSNVPVRQGVRDGDPGERPPLPHAKKAPDGKWYAPDPVRGSGYVRVDAKVPAANKGGPTGG